MNPKSKTEQVVDILSGKIKNGTLVPGKKLPAERVLHEQLSVSRVIIRRALDILTERKLVYKKGGSGSYITENAINEIIRQEAGKKTVKAGFVFHHRWSRDSFFQDIIRELKSRLPENVELKVFFQDHLKREEFIDKNIKILFIDHSYSDQEIETLDGSGIFSIALLRKPELKNYLFFDNFDSGFKIGKMFSEYGHKTVAFINDYPWIGENELRIKGLEAATRKFGLEIIHASITIRATVGDIRNTIDYLFSSRKKFTAILVGDDNRAYMAYDVLNNMNISVPDDISLAGFNNNMCSSMFSIPLTSVGFPVSNVCDLMVDAIKQFIETGNTEFRKTVPPVLINRNSVKRLSI